MGVVRGRTAGRAAIRLLLAGLLAASAYVQAARAQAPPPPPSNSGSSETRSALGAYIVGGVIVGIVGWALADKFLTKRDPIIPPAEPLPPSGPSFSQLSNNPPPPRAVRPGRAPTQSLRSGFRPPPVGETRFVPNEVIVDIPASSSAQTLDAVAARFAMTRLETTRIALTGRTLHRWRLNTGGSIRDVIGEMSGERRLAGAQPNYLYALAQQAVSNGDQYAPDKLNVPAAHRFATGNRVLVAVIDSAVDASHPDLAGAIAANFETSADDATPHMHGTGMAGAIAARRTVLSMAPRAALLTVRAFSPSSNSAQGTTYNIIKGLDWAAGQGARVVNMSFAGPPDPGLSDIMLRAYRRGIVLIAAAGNAGPNSPPLYPAADATVIAVTATDINDSLFSGANRGGHVAVAAPGVNILAPAPGGGYQFTTGTSIAAAEVSGVVALLIERNSALTPSDIRELLMRTAKDLGPAGRDPEFGAGLVNALRAVSAAAPR